jgi:hypothetical protein
MVLASQLFAGERVEYARREKGSANEKVDDVEHGIFSCRFVHMVQGTSTWLVIGSSSVRVTC